MLNLKTRPVSSIRRPTTASPAIRLRSKTSSARAPFSTTESAAPRAVCPARRALAQRRRRWRGCCSSSAPPWRRRGWGDRSGEGRAHARRAVSDVSLPSRRSVGSNRLLLALVPLVWAVVAAPLVLGWRTLFQRDVSAVHLHLKWVGGRRSAPARCRRSTSNGPWGSRIVATPTRWRSIRAIFSISSCRSGARSTSTLRCTGCSLLHHEGLGARARPERAVGASCGHHLRGKGWLLAASRSTTSLRWRRGGRWCWSGLRAVECGGGPWAALPRAWPSCAASRSPRRSGCCRSCCRPSSVKVGDAACSPRRRSF